MDVRIASRTLVVLGLAVAGLASCGLPQRLPAADNLFWIGGPSNQWSDGQNWSGFAGLGAQPAGAIPGTDNFAVFEQSAAVSFSSGEPPTTGSVQVLNGSVSFTLGPIDFGDILAHTLTTNQLYVVAPFEDSSNFQQYNSPNGINASLFVSGGTLIVNGQTEIGGGDSRNTGTLTLQASELITNGDLTIAQSAHGYLNIGTASLVMSSGGNAIIGSQTGSVGSVTVSGGSVWLLDASSPLAVGNQGAQGSLLVEGGSLVAGDTLNIGSTTPTPAAVTVDGSGTQLNFTHLNVGSGGGSLTVQNGAAVTSGTSDGTVRTNIGTLNGLTGTATVTGAGSSWNTHGLAVGDGSGTGSLLISAGGSVTSSDYVSSFNSVPTTSSIGGSSGSVTLTGSGSSWTINGGLSIAQFGNGSASLSVGVGSSVGLTTTLQVNQGGTVQVDGTLSAATLNVNGGSFTQTGTVNLSDSTTHVGTLSISGGGSYTGAPTLAIPSMGNTDATGQAYVQDAGSTWTIPGPYFLGAGGGLGTASISQGGTVTSGDLGIGEKTAGQLQVDGTGASWSTTGIITVGTAAAGSIFVGDQGSVSAGTLTINANGAVTAKSNSSLQATNLNVNGGSLKIDGGTVTSTSTTFVSGMAQVTRGGWSNSGTFYVGGDSLGAAASGTASLYVYGGSNTVGGLLKIWSPGQVTVDNGGTLIVNGVDIEGGSLDVYDGQVTGAGGHGSAGTLTVAAGGEYSQAQGPLSGAFSGINVNASLFSIQGGTIHVRSGQTLSATNGAIIQTTNNNALQIDQGGIVSITNSTLTAQEADISGELDLSNPTLNLQQVNLQGGTIVAVATLVVNSSIKGTGAIQGNVQLAGGSLQGNGGTLAVSGDVSGVGVLIDGVTYNSLTPTAQLTISGNKNDLGNQTATLVSLGPANLAGTLTSEGGTLNSANGLAIAPTGALVGDVTVNGDVTNDGLLDVGGDAIGLDAIYGNLVLDSTSVVRVQIGGTDPSDYDQIMVKNGNVTLGGTLDLVFTNGFLPQQGDVFNIFIDGYSGQFSNLEVSGLGNWDYALGTGPNGLTLNSLDDASPVPEPGTLTLLASAALLLLAYRYRGLIGRRLARAA